MLQFFHMKCVVAGNFHGVIQTEYFHFHKTNHSEIATLVTQVFKYYWGPVEDESVQCGTCTHV